MSLQKKPISGHLLSILIIEDQVMTALAIKKFLEFRGHTVATATNEAEALENAKKIQPRVVISDWKLKDGDDGVLVAKRLQEEYQTTIFMVTARKLDDLQSSLDQHHLKVAGVARKPVSLNQLAEMIESV